MYYFTKIQNGPHTVDCITNVDNKKLDGFNLLFWTAGSEALNVLSQNCANENNWLVPPIYLISSVIRHLLACKTLNKQLMDMQSNSYLMIVFVFNFSCET